MNFVTHASGWIPFLAAASFLMELLFPGPVYAYPERPIRMIIPWAAGGDTDVVKRVFAHHLQKHLGQPVIVANVTGASGTVGAREAKAAPPDGYTIYSVHDYIHGTYYTGITDINYWDFEPVCRVVFTPNLVGANAATKWNAMADLVADAKKRPGQITFGVTLGSTTHFFAAFIEKETGAKWRYVSYEGTAPRMTALLGGHIDLGRVDLTQMDKVKAGQLKLLGIATEERHPVVPNVMTLKEQGINVVYGENRGILAPKGTPDAVLAKLEDACGKVAKESSFSEEMRKQGTDIKFLGRKAYAEFLKSNDLLTKEAAAAVGILKRR
ncbi:MAG TPA: tripartite tricarboxylate transporter substrate binding protein [Candidatus Eisenbacteria bacterium]|nr:tripartite tricarboxylate transporter substrate binding protein [Candidatus Eisenbacteria bacterium]